MDDVRPMAHIDQFWAHRNAQRGHTPREILIIPSSLLQYLVNSNFKSKKFADLSIFSKKPHIHNKVENKLLDNRVGNSFMKIDNFS
jgi:hypothetical protein